MNLFNPGGVAAPRGTFSHGALLPPGTSLLYIAGQVGLRPDGTLPERFEEQVEAAWANLVAVLAQGGMSVEHLAKVNSYLTRTEDIPKYGPIRARYLGSHRPASTLVVVAALANPGYLVEVEGVAARREA